MSNKEQFWAPHSAVEAVPEGDEIFSDADMNPMQSETVFHQVPLSGPTSSTEGRTMHLLNAEPGRSNYLTGSDKDDEIHGSALDDVILGEAGNDRLHGDGGNDVLLGDEGIDLLLAGDGDDTLDGGDGADVLNGNSGDDILMGESGDDYLGGGDGGDILVGGVGADLLAGDNGDDIYRFDRGDGQDKIINWGSSPYATPQDGGHDIIEYGRDIGDEQLWLRRMGDDLMVTNIETGDSQLIEQWYRGDAYRIDELHLADGKCLSGEHVEPLVAAMASLPMPAVGTHHLAPSYQSVLNPVLAASWR